ncbi:MAG: carbohydrate ABC transporter permease [Bacilli bacterium]
MLSSSKSLEVTRSEKPENKRMKITFDKAAKRSKIVVIIRKIIVYIVLILLSILCVFPFYILIVNCTRSNFEIQQGFSFTFGNFFLYNWESLFSDTNIPMAKALLNSLFISLCTATLAVYFSSLTAYAFHQYNFKGKNALFTFVLLIMMVPTTISSLGLLTLAAKYNLIDTYYPLILPAAASPIIVFYMRQYLDSVMPKELVEAARVDGSGELSIFHRIVIPVLKPAMAVQFIFAFVASWNNYFFPALIIQSTNKKTVPLIIAGLVASDPTTFDLGKVYMLMTIAIIPLLIMYLLLSKFIIRGVTLGSVKG